MKLMGVGENTGHRNILIGVVAAGIMLSSLIGVTADVLEMPSIFSSGMVLQAEMPIPVWGWTKPGEEVNISFAGQELKAMAGIDGLWMARLKPMKVSSEGSLLTVKGATGTIALEDVLVGEVWLCSGQSNMSLRLPRCKNGDNEVANANDKDLRFLSVPDYIPYPCDTPMERCLPRKQGGYSWKKLSPDTAADISAIGCFFAKEIRRETNRPVGIILAARGGTNAECWLRREALMTDPVFAAYVTKTEGWKEKYPEARKQWEDTLSKWNIECKEAKANGKSKPARPNPDGDQAILGLHFWASSCFNTHMASLIPYAVRGVLWYQGEGNGSRCAGSAGGYDYQRLLPLLIIDWRNLWGQERLPFYIVQLANFGKPSKDPNDKNTGWSELREAQSIVSEKVPDSGLAVTLDIGDPKDIHPGNKQEVGRRLALIARSKVYGQKELVFSGPRYISFKIEGATIRLEFDSTNGGLIAKDGNLSGFTIAGDERRFAWADARIDGNAVVLSSPAIKKPVAARYAWQQGSEASLFNGAGLPASPFRTDDWPGLTWPKSVDVGR